MVGLAHVQQLPRCSPPVLCKSDLGGTIMIVPVPKAVTMSSDAGLIKFIFLNIVIDCHSFKHYPI